MAARMVWDYVVRVQFSALRPIPSSSKVERQCEELSVRGAVPREETIRGTIRLKRATRL